jgi:energy-coupling factor transporter transmembrane protein EcfT
MILCDDDEIMIFVLSPIHYLYYISKPTIMKSCIRRLLEMEKNGWSQPDVMFVVVCFSFVVAKLYGKYSVLLFCSPFCLFALFLYFIVMISLFNCIVTQSEAAVENALKLDGSEFKGRNLKITSKRVNVAGFNQQQAYEQGGRGAGRGGRGGRGGFVGRGGGR